MTAPFLILHKVRGQPAFDIAEQIDCPLCAGSGGFGQVNTCGECDGLGFWWIIPTSGHRAYPYWNEQLSNIELTGYPITYLDSFIHDEVMPPDLPDHYPTKKSTEAPKIDAGSLLAQLVDLLPKERRRA